MGDFRFGKTEFDFTKLSACEAMAALEDIAKLHAAGAKDGIIHFSEQLRMLRGQFPTDVSVEYLEVEGKREDCYRYVADAIYHSHEPVLFHLSNKKTGDFYSIFVPPGSIEHPPLKIMKHVCKNGKYK